MLRKKIDGLLLRQNKRRAIVEPLSSGEAGNNDKAWPDSIAVGLFRLAGVTGDTGVVFKKFQLEDHGKR